LLARDDAIDIFRHGYSPLAVTMSSTWTFILCSGAAHLSAPLIRHGVHLPTPNYDGRRFFPNSDVYARLQDVEGLAGQRVCVVQSCTRSGDLEDESFSTSDRFVETLQVLDILRNPVAVASELDVTPLNPPSEVTVVYTFLPFSKQDYYYATGECNAAKLAIDITLKYASKVVTIDPHPPTALDWVRRYLQDGRFVRLSVMPDLVTRATALFTLDDPLILTPPGKSRYDQIAIASSLRKRRLDSYTVVVEGEAPVNGRDVILIDDLILSGTTLQRTVHRLENLGARRVVACVPHATPLVDEGEARLRKLVEQLDGRLVVSNTIPSKTFEADHSDLVVDCSHVITDYLSGA
jgi:phosphoribosylpyrophosphate synthetase